MTRIVVTGGNGFIGRVLCRTLTEAGLKVRAAVRRIDQGSVLTGLCDTAEVGDIGAATDWTAALSGVDAVVHLAARVHVMEEAEKDPLAAFRRVNLKGTENLARQAGAAGINRFIFVSTIKVNGERTHEKAFSADDPAFPQDPYGISKWEAEQALKAISAASGMEWVVIRPPLVYGECVKGNFLRLLNWVEAGIPLPFGALVNLRSLAYVENVCHLLKTCIVHPRAAGQAFLVSDGPAVSTKALVQSIAEAMNRRLFLPPIPETILRWSGILTKKSKEMERLCGSLRVDIEKNRALLDWVPPFRLAQGLEKTVAWYLSQKDAKSG